MDYEKEIEDLKKRITYLEDCCKTLKARLEKKEDKKEPLLPSVWPPPPPQKPGLRVIIEDQPRQ
jgi:hypothetical protein